MAKVTKEKSFKIEFLEREENIQDVNITFTNDNVFTNDMIIAIGAIVTKVSQQTGIPKDSILKQAKALLINNKHAKAETDGENE